VIARRWQIAVALLGGLLALILCLPLRLVLPETLLSARSVSGSIWSGRIEGAAIGPVRLGALKTAPRWPGVLHVVAESAPGSDALSLDITPGDALTISHAQGKLPLDMAFGPVSAEAIDLRSVALKMDEGGCVTATGRIIAQARLSAAALLPPLALSGTLDCVGRDLATVMKSQSGLEQIEFRLYPNRNWQARILIRPASPELADLLRANGFAESPLGYVRVAQGTMGN
jgi:general secretion pathway protein N